MLTGMTRRLDPLGRIVLPMEMRRKMGLHTQQLAAFDIQAVENTFVLTLLEDVEQRCSACGNIEIEYAKFGKIHLCENCVDDVIETSLK